MKEVFRLCSFKKLLASLDLEEFSNLVLLYCYGYQIFFSINFDDLIK